jgi:hypothetical protein
MIGRLLRVLAWRRRCHRLDAALADRRATRAAYRQAQLTTRAEREAERLRKCREALSAAMAPRP